MSVQIRVGSCALTDAILRSIRAARMQSICCSNPAAVLFVRSGFNVYQSLTSASLNVLLIIRRNTGEKSVSVKTKGLVA